jgi:predicted transposase YdaD
MPDKTQISNLFRPFRGLNPKESNVYKYFLEEGYDLGKAEGKAETARRFHQRMGLSAAEIAGIVDEPVETVEQWLQ